MFLHVLYKHKIFQFLNKQDFPKFPNKINLKQIIIIFFKL